MEEYTVWAKKRLRESVGWEKKKKYTDILRYTFCVPKGLGSFPHGCKETSSVASHQPEEEEEEEEDHSCKVRRQFEGSDKFKRMCQKFHQKKKERERSHAPSPSLKLKEALYHQNAFFPPIPTLLPYCKVDYDMLVRLATH